MSVHVRSVEQLADLVTSDLQGKARLLVCIAGVPGAGKSTMVEKIIEHLRTKNVVSKALPQDGYHYYRRELEQFEDPQEAFRRRGAPFTFNAEAFVSSVRKLRTHATVTAPLFDHSKKDPSEGAIVIGPEVQVVFIEGNYVGLKDEPWAELDAATDRLWMIQQDPGLVRERLIQRHVSSGVCRSYEDAVERCDGLDWQNAVYVMENSRAPDVVVTLG
ncbi:P-loop containing nucleoside triphosphate hydrolase protein [Metschnikowia bicuspidata var. bicuspidata NRRL YB-4993]|uniref:p-loop containing nucleoside triphosphate hydrolase protein n=1 Tax=Metschnikowia bicuspidata var. bicuspidata NRRL YB-4993 TaxID=869754 RepID=A0A1A0GYZ4_9ASCO|nr:P-loop containing nucleoside triphosphate hydrolase protein [Metschnikowia bicuspidata var. bicuspidata NRRL YB-4993]OBA16994.1 P-loop containing nucleoside triphosphate hydrolase protein [Metschnikowia bicuspidata var. bicuspidata NRRL YB-4993]